MDCDVKYLLNDMLIAPQVWRILRRNSGYDAHYNDMSPVQILLAVLSGERRHNLIIKYN